MPPGLHFISLPRVTRLAVISLLLTCAVALRAHPEIEAALHRINALIAASPDNAELYLERGDLYSR